jgi:4-hydroxy 2-oxovalerate aldolase
MGNNMPISHLDCTLRDGGYYNDWDFPEALVAEYLRVMASIGVEVVEIGLRSTKNDGFKGAYAFSSDKFIRALPIPPNLTIGVMINASELVGEVSAQQVLEKLFPLPASESPLGMVRIACHVLEFAEALKSVCWLKDRGFQVGVNLMQIADLGEQEIGELAKLASSYPVDVLYFADSVGSMTPRQISETVTWMRSGWGGPLGIHTHDNLGLALSNTLAAISEGVTWVDSTVTGMGRGPGNARTEELVIELSEFRGNSPNLVALTTLIRKYFKPMQTRCGWGTNPFYYMAGKYGIHPSYIQDMLGDARYSEEDLVAVIEYLRLRGGGKKFNKQYLDAARHIYHDIPCGSWDPTALFSNRDVLLLGNGPGANRYSDTLESYIERARPLVVALNTHAPIRNDLIDIRVACHPVRLLTDCKAHGLLPQPLVTPYSMLHDEIKRELEGKTILDFGLSVQVDAFRFGSTSCAIPAPLVIAYALAVATSGNARRVMLAGFDGYDADDPRRQEIDNTLNVYQKSEGALELIAVTPTHYRVRGISIFGM